MRKKLPEDGTIELRKFFVLFPTNTTDGYRVWFGFVYEEYLFSEFDNRWVFTGNRWSTPEGKKE